MRHPSRIAALAVALLVPLALGGCFADPNEPKDMVLPTKSPAPSAPESTPAPEGSVLLYADETPVLIWKAGNDGAIEGGNGKPPRVTHDQAYYVTQICTYHWNNGTGGTVPGFVSLRAADGTDYGPWQTELVNKVYWCAIPNLVIAAGTYTLTDSDPATWAQNSGSNGTGMGWAYGVPAK